MPADNPMAKPAPSFPILPADDPYRECFVVVSRALQGQKGKRVAEALKAMSRAQSHALFNNQRLEWLELENTVLRKIMRKFFGAHALEGESVQEEKPDVVQ